MSQADVSKAEDVRRLLAQARSQFGAIDGIIHGAGVLRDSLLRKKTREEMQAVLAPKVSRHLPPRRRSRATRRSISSSLFSSLAAVGGNAGQCDYAFANHYMDCFAARRERAAGERAPNGQDAEPQLVPVGRRRHEARRADRAVLQEEPRHPAVAHARSASRRSSTRCGWPGRSSRCWKACRPRSSGRGALAKKRRRGAAAPVRCAGSARPRGRWRDLAGLVIKELSAQVMALLKLDAEDLSLDSDPARPRVRLDRPDHLRQRDQRQLPAGHQPGPVLRISLDPGHRGSRSRRSTAARWRRSTAPADRPPRSTTPAPSAALPLEADGGGDPVFAIGKGWKPPVAPPPPRPRRSAFARASLRRTSRSPSSA